MRFQCRQGRLRSSGDFADTSAEGSEAFRARDERDCGGLRAVSRIAGGISGSRCRDVTLGPRDHSSGSANTATAQLLFSAVTINQSTRFPGFCCQRRLRSASGSRQ